MTIRKIARALLFPPPALLALIAPLAFSALAYSFAALGETDPRRIASYVLSFYALVIVCLRAPQMFAWTQRFRRENRYLLRYTGDVCLRMNISLWGSCAYNAAYALFQLALGMHHRSAWFYAMAGYYALLATLRLSLGYRIRRSAPGADQPSEWRVYRLCGAGLLMMNAALSVFVLYFVRHLRATQHHEITVIAMAAYTFGAATLAVVNLIRYRRYESPVCSAAKAISLATAAISMLSLEDAMLTTFGAAQRPLFRAVMLGASGMAAALLIIGMAFYMIRRANRYLKKEQETPS